MNRIQLYRPQQQQLRPKCSLYFLVALITLLTPWSEAFRARAATVPPEFVDILVAKRNMDPTAFDFTPDGRLVIASRPGHVYVYRDGTYLGRALDISNVVCTNIERGLLGIAVDPNFTSNRYLYLFYTFNRYNQPPDNCATGTNIPVNRVSRFTVPDTNIINPASEEVLIDNIGNDYGFHNAGDLHFGADGLLYISSGDGTISVNAQSLRKLNGKILRIDPTGPSLIPSTNPFANSPNAQRCGDADGDNGPGPCQELFAYGLRNPFRFTFRPGTNEFFINDVGEDAWEEIDQGQTGANYGWPCREGNGEGITTGPCDPLPPNLTDPIFAYAHGSSIPGTTSPTNCRAITAGAFVPNGLWPGYDGTYIFADFVCNEMFALRPNGGGGWMASNFASGFSVATSMLFGPYNGTQGLYYSALSDGEIRVIVYSQAPSAAISANPTFGPTPLPVTFSAVGSRDPANRPLTFDWNYGDGVVLTGTTNLTVTHTYPATGVYTASVIARDDLGLVSPPTRVQIAAGYAPPVPVIQSPALGSQYAVGQPITLSGTASDSDSQDTPDRLKLKWTVLIHHIDLFDVAGEHTHPWYVTTPITSTTASITNTTTMPPPEGTRATLLSYLEVRLTATDSLGLSSAVTRTVQPVRVNVTLETQPSGLNLILNDDVITSPQTVVSWLGYGLSLSAPVLQSSGQGQAWLFSSWSDGGPATHTINTPAQPATYVATYQLANRLWFPIIRK